MENKTPAQLAKDYAAEHGFVITPVGRRYIITCPEAQYDTHVADVGGYPAALNAMRKYVEAGRSCDGAGNDPWAHDGGCKFDDEPIAHGIPSDASYGVLEEITPEQAQQYQELLLQRKATKRVLDDRHDPFGADLQEQYKRLYHCNPTQFVRLVELARGCVLDALAHAAEAPEREPLQSDHAYRVQLQGMGWTREQAALTVDAVTYDEVTLLPAHMQRRSLPPTHVLVFRWKGGEMFSQFYPSHAEALRSVRQMMCKKRMRPDYVSIEPIGMTA